MQLHIDMWRRFWKQRAHTATHLLHAALQQYFPLTKQEWSFVGDDELRFDFSADNLLSTQDLMDINKTINEYIHQAIPVQKKLMKYNDAIDSGAKAFFADTYWDEVRVVTIGAEWEDWNVSVELCGWNHVENTADIWAFVIVWQEAVAAGIKRIHAYTWPRVVQRVQEYEELLNGLVAMTGLKQATQLQEKVEKILKEHADAQDTIQEMKKSLLQIIADTNSALYKSPIDLNLIREKYSILTNQDIISFLENSQSYGKSSRVAYADGENESVVTIYDPVDMQAKQKAQTIWLKWWWTDKKVTGKLWGKYIK